MFYRYDHGKKSTTKGGSVEFDIKNKNVTHIIIQQEATTNLSASSFNVKVEAYTKELSGVICDNLPNTILEQFSDAEFGHPAQSTTSKIAVVNIGSLRLNDQESLTVTVVDTATGTHTVAEFNLISIYANPSMDRVFQYGVSKSSLNNFQNVNAVIINLANALVTDSFDIQIDNYSTIMNVPAIKLIDAIQKNNLLDASDLAIVLNDEKFMPHTFGYEYKGNQAIQVYYRRILASKQRVVRSIRQIIADGRLLVDKVKNADNQTAEGLQAGGVLPTIDVLNHLHSRVDIDERSKFESSGFGNSVNFD